MHHSVCVNFQEPLSFAITPRYGVAIINVAEVVDLKPFEAGTFVQQVVGAMKVSHVQIIVA